MRLTPHYFFLQYTTLCNSRCITCNLWDVPPQTLTVEQVKRIDRFIDPANLREVYFTGGEPFLPPNCVEVACAVADWKPGVVFSCATNGIAPDLYLPRVAAMRANGVDIRCLVSINGRPGTHDKSRGYGGNYANAIRMIEGLRDLGALVSINILHIPGLQEQADFDHAEQVAAKYGQRLFHSHMLRHNPWFGMADDGATIPPFDCHAGDVLTIRPNGDITACQEPRPALVFGNLDDDHLDEAKAVAILESIKRRECQPCGCCTSAFTHGARCLT